MIVSGIGKAGIAVPDVIHVGDDLPVVGALAAHGTLIAFEITFDTLPELPGCVFLSCQGDGPVDIASAAVV